MDIQALSTSPLIRYVTTAEGQVYFCGEDILQAFGLEQQVPEPVGTLNANEAYNLAVKGQENDADKFKLYEELAAFIGKVDVDTSQATPPQIEWNRFRSAD